MNIFNTTDDFDAWLAAITDGSLKSLVLRRIAQARLGNFGDHKWIGSGVFEMRIHYGSGWRLYYAQEGRYLYLLLSAGSKSSQRKDIQKAIAMWQQIKGDTP